MAGGLLAAYLAVGRDQLKREATVRRLKARLEEGLEAFNLDELERPQDIDPTELAVSLNTLPVGEGPRLVLVHDAGHLAKPVSETIVSYLKNPNPGCVLLLECESLAKTTRLYKAVAACGKRAVIDCAPPTAQNLPNHVIKMARAKGIACERDAAAELVSRAGEDTTLIDAHLTTLAELCRDRGRVTRADVEANVARTAEVRPWEFLDKVAAADAKGALELYRTMQSPSHLGLVTLLTRRFRELVCARALAERGATASLASELGLSEWQTRRLVAPAKKRTPEHLRRCMAALAAAERALKSGADAEGTFVDLVLALCGHGVA